MFTPESRAELRDALVETARRDPSIAAAALVGSGATGREDEWSDIDLALCLSPGMDPRSAADAWTVAMYEQYGAVHHLDVWATDALYRVFLLGSSLQVDLSFWPNGDFRATESSFRLLFGETGEPTTPPTPQPEQLAGMGWLYGLHARSAIARGRHWQAVLMLDGVRDQIIALACLRHGLNPYQGRGVDDLPSDLISAVLAPIRAREAEPSELRRSLATSTTTLLDEISKHDPGLAAHLADAARILARPDR